MQRWGTILAVGFLILATGVAVRIAGAPVGVRAGTEATPPNAMPVTCDAVIAAGVTAVFDCRRGGDRTLFAGVPDGHYLLVTDILITRNNLATTGNYHATVGRGAGADIPDTPRFTLSGTALETDAQHFQAPYIILQSGETLAIRNDGSSDFPINAYASGFLVTDVTYQVLMQNYLPLIAR